MTWRILAMMVGGLLLAKAAWAEEPAADVGRYHVIPDALVPGKTGEARERAVLVDSATGRTWYLAPGATSGYSSQPHWVPMQLKVDGRIQALADTPRAAEGRDATEAGGAKARNAKTRSEKLRERLRNEYDDNP